MSELWAIDKNTLIDIANAVRRKKGSADLIKVTDLANEISSIEAGGGMIIKAGKYKMVDYIYESYIPGAFSWSTQLIHGKFSWVDENIIDADFTEISNDGDFSLIFSNNGTRIGAVYPYWSISHIVTVTLDESFLVSTEFKSWFETCFAMITE